MAAGRVVPSAFFLASALAKLQALADLLRDRHDLPDRLVALSFYATCAYRAATIVFFLLIAAFFAIRLNPVRSSPGAWQTIVALAGTYCMMLVSVAGQANVSPAVTIVAAVIMCGGTVFSALALIQLGRSLSISPEARRLVTTGLYAVIRHPMYLGEMLGSVGMVLQSMSPVSALVFAVFCLLQIKRMDYEEGVLQSVFPDYCLYRARTARLIPGIY